MTIRHRETALLRGGGGGGGGAEIVTNNENFAKRPSADGRQGIQKVFYFYP